MNLAPAESFPAQVMLSPRLLSELGNPHSTLRATTQRNGPVVIVRAGGEIDASNEHIWQRLVGEAAAVARQPGHSSSTSMASVSWVAARLPRWPPNRSGAVVAASNFAW